MSEKTLHVLTVDNLDPNYFDVQENKITYKLSEDPENLLKFDEMGRLSLDRRRIRNAEVIWEGLENGVGVEIFANDFALYNCIPNNEWVLKTIVIGKKDSDIEYSHTCFHINGVKNIENFYFIEPDDKYNNVTYDYGHEDTWYVSNDKVLNFRFVDCGYSIKIINIPRDYYVKKIILL